MKEMACGNCGCRTFSVHGEDNHHAERIDIKCTDCGSTTVLTVEQPRITLDWGKGADGVLCFLSRDEDVKVIENRLRKTMASINKHGIAIRWRGQVLNLDEVEIRKLRENDDAEEV